MPPNTARTSNVKTFRLTLSSLENLLDFRRLHDLREAVLVAFLADDCFEVYQVVPEISDNFPVLGPIHENFSRASGAQHDIQVHHVHSGAVAVISSVCHITLPYDGGKATQGG